MNELIPRATIEQVVGYRDKALELYAEAWNELERGHEAVKRAQAMAQQAHPGINGYNHANADEIKAFARAIKLPARERYLRTARKLVDCDTWAWIVERTDLERLMDKEAKDQLRRQMQYVPDKVDRDGQLITQDEIEQGLPPITVENVYATLQHFAASADMIFRRGIANAFSKLDRRFKSHDGFKVGHRIILDRAFNEHGMHWGWQQDTLLDVERAFLVLDEREVAAYGGVLHQLRQEVGWKTPRPVVVETDYFRIRVFANGNAHLWMLRKDLVAKVNKLLAEWYGEVIADGMQAEDDPLEKRKTTPAKFFGFYPTPKEAADHLFHGVSFYRRKDDAPMRVLEPSAGTGNLARVCAQHREQEYRGYGHEPDRWSYRPRVDCVEVQQHHAEALDAEGIYNRVICGDFLQLRPEPVYDLVVMNPPFDLERDIDHVTHALKFLKPDGELHAIMSAGTEWRETRKSKAFRALVQKMNGRFTDLPACSFSTVGTNVNTVILRVAANGRQIWR